MAAAMSPPAAKAPGTRPPASRRGVFAWMLYDWANQPFYTLVLTFIFAPYFAASVAPGPVAGQAMWGTATAIAGAAVALLAAPLGAVADRTGARKPWVLAFSIPFVVGCIGLWTGVPGMSQPWLVLGFFVLAYVGGEFTLIFTNAMLPDLGPRERIGRISGSGWAVGYLGGLASLVLVLVFLTAAPGSERTLLGLAPAFGLDPAAGEPSRATGPLTALWYAVFALPLFLFTPDAPRRAARGALRKGLGDLADTLRTIRGKGTLALYLLASLFYRDGLASLFVFGGIFAAGILGWGMFELGIFGIVAAAAGALGAWAGGKADATFGPKPVVTAGILTLIAVSILVLLTGRDTILFIPVPEGSWAPDAVFIAAGAVLGAMAGTIQAASRTLLVDQAEGHVASAQAFGLYALSGKATAFVGPAMIAAVTGATGSQRLGISPVIVQFLLGLALLYWVKTAGKPQPERAG
ncbi:MFS transporter [soil metagenome]